MDTILALESSTGTASIALLHEGNVRQTSFSAPPQHSATLLPEVEALLQASGLTIRDLDLIACGIGPGAFTGVRLACGVAQGLALALDIPVVPVSSLRALAQACAVDRVYCAMDARMGEAYVALYERNTVGWMEKQAPVCVPPAGFPLPPGQGWSGVGTAFGVYGRMLDSGLLASVKVLDADAVPDARSILQLAQSMASVDPAELAPLYVRDRVALTVAERLAAGGRA